MCGVVPPLDIVEPGESEAGLQLFLQGGLRLVEQLCTARECFVHKGGHFHGICFDVNVHELISQVFYIHSIF